MILKPIIPIYVVIASLALVIIIAIFCTANRKYCKSSNYIRLGILTLLLVALLRPAIPSEAKTQSLHSNTVLYFIVDNTGSMAVEDEDNKTRIKALSADMEKIINNFEMPRVGIFAQDVITYRMMPVSSDIKTALSLARNLGPKNTSSSEGSNLNKLIKEAADYINNYSKTKKDAEIAVFIMSDGENAINGSQSYNLAKDDFSSVAYGAVIGYGSAEGGKVPNYVAYLDTDTGVLSYRKHPSSLFVTDEENKEVVSRIDEIFLKDTAKLYGFNYVKSTDGIDQIIQSAKDNIKNTQYLDDASDINVAFETYWIFTMLAGVLLLVEFSRDFNSLLAEREVKK